MIRKAALSLFVIGASGAYVWGQSTAPSDSTVALPPPASTAPPTRVAIEPRLIVREATGDDNATVDSARSVAPVKVQSIAIDPAELAPKEDASARLSAAGDDDAPATEPPVISAPPSSLAPHPAARRNALPTPIRVSARMTSGRRLNDGRFDGPAIDAFYGLVEIEAVVQGGKLADINVLRYPSDRRVSVAINRRALPILKREAIAAQSANVDFVSGATLTSEAFVESLGSALRQASG
jgi:uncharacterized protein with FMN-binding domain